MANATEHVSIPVLGKMGVEVLEVTPTRVRAKMPLAGNHNHVGTMYAGCLFTLAEFPAGILFVNRVDTKKIAPLVADMKIRFRRPATTDITVDFVMAEEDLQRLHEQTMAEGKASLHSTQQLTDEHGEVVAITEARYVWLKLGD